MSYIALDIFSDEQMATVRAEAYRQAGKKLVRLVKTEDVTVNDCTGDTCIARHTQSGNPLYIVISGSDPICI